jgi:hypothetical protein
MAKVGARTPTDSLVGPVEARECTEGRGGSVEEEEVAAQIQTPDRVQGAAAGTLVAQAAQSQAQRMEEVEEALTL